MVKLLASPHARERARQRIGWHRRTLERMLERVFYDGLGPEDCSRRLGEFVTSTINTAAGLSRIYGEHLFLFTRDLIRPSSSARRPYSLPATHYSLLLSRRPPRPPPAKRPRRLNQPHLIPFRTPRNTNEPL